MGMSIEDIIQGLKETNMICNSVFAYDRKKYIDGAIDKLCKYQMMQADYEARLRADMVAMLKALWVEIKECSISENAQNKNRVVYMKRVDEIIQQKINALKGVNNE